MAEKGTKKPAADGVLGALPATRPNRMATRRRGGAAPTPKAAAEAVADKPAKPRAAAKKAAAKAKAKQSPAAKKLAAKPKAAAVKAKTAAKAKPLAKPTPITDAASSRPKPVKSASKNLAAPARKSAAKRKPMPAPEKAPSGTELVSTVVQAAGELAQVGLSIGGQVLKRAVDRLPKP